MNASNDWNACYRRSAQKRRYNLRMHRSRLTALCLLSYTALAATQSRAQETPSDPLYHVEIVVFEQLDGGRSEEDFYHGLDNPLQDPPPVLLRLPRFDLETLTGFVPRRNTLPFDFAEPPDEQPAAAVEAPLADTANTSETADAAPELPGDALELFELADENRSEPIRFTGPLPDGFRVLVGDELELDDVRADIYRRREYRVLGHAGWAQTGVPENRSIPVDLQALGVTNPSGTIMVYLENYLHVAVNLEFTDGRGTFWTASPGTGLTGFAYARRYRLETEPQITIRRGELVYIDHPLFGVIVRIIRAPDPVEPQAGNSVDGPAA